MILSNIFRANFRSKYHNLLLRLYTQRKNDSLELRIEYLNKNKRISVCLKNNFCIPIKNVWVVKSIKTTITYSCMISLTSLKDCLLLTISSIDIKKKIKRFRFVKCNKLYFIVYLFQYRLKINDSNELKHLSISL